MKRRSPIAKAVTRIRPQVIPDKRSRLLKKGNRLFTQDEVLDAKQAMGDKAEDNMVIIQVEGLTDNEDFD